MKANKDKPFDCIKLKRELQARVYEETKDLNDDELREYFRRAVEESPWADLFRASKQRESI